MTTTRTRAAASNGGFTLIELLVVVAIIALLIGLLLPALTQARQSAQNLICLTNMRSLGQSLVLYTNDNNSEFPQNTVGVSGGDPSSWFDNDVIGEYMERTELADEASTDSSVGGVFVCPFHPEGGRSYAMNYWASSNLNKDENETANGEPFKLNTVRNPTQTLLLAEAWGQFRSSANPITGQIVYLTASTMGSQGTPGERFGGGNGVNDWPGDAFSRFGRAGAPEMEVGRNPRPRSYMPYYRHPRRQNDTFDIQGSFHMASVDGTVSRPEHTDVLDTDTGFSTGKVLWSNKDRSIIAENTGN